MKYRVVIVEDEPPILEMLVDMFERASYPLHICDSCSNGREGLEAVRKYEPHILITDIRMPFMDGIELIESVNRDYPDVRCVILSGYSDFEYARSAVKLNVFEYLLKPILPEAIENLLNQLSKSMEDFFYKEKGDSLQDIIYGNGGTDIVNSSLHTSYHIIMLFSDIAHKLNDAKNNLEGNDFIESELMNIWPDRTWYLLRGHKYEDKIILIEDDQQRIKKGGVIQLFKWLDTHGLVQVVENNESVTLKDLFNTVRNMYEFIRFHGVYGQSKLYYYRQSLGCIWDREYISSSIKYVSYKGKSSMIIFKESLKCLLEECKSKQVTKRCLISTLNNFLQSIFRNNPISIETDKLVDTISDYEKLYTEICALVYEQLQTSHGGMDLTAVELVDTIEAYILEHYSEDISYKTFKSIFSYNEVYITNVFKERKGITPSKFLTDVRLKKAMKIINENPTIMLKDVSNMVGYKDPLYFSRVFKNTIGLSPSKYALKVNTKMDI